MDKHIIDAEGKSLGRVATQVATLLRGKHIPTFELHIAPKTQVIIVNASKLNINQKKKETTSYARYSGYPGGLRFETMEHLIKQKGYGALLERAVSGMIPKNKLHKEIMKNLTITE